MNVELHVSIVRHFPFEMLPPDLQSKGTIFPVTRVDSLKQNIWAYQFLRIEDKIVHLKVSIAHIHVY